MGDSESCSSRASESSPPVHSRKRRQKVEVFHEVLRRLKQLNFEEAEQPGFEVELWAHFNSLPHRYALDVNTERAEDVLMHKKLLEMAHDPSTRPAVEIRLVQVRPMFGDSIHSSFGRRGDIQGFDRFDSLHLPPAFGSLSYSGHAREANGLNSHVENNSGSWNSHLSRPLHEITISTNDRRKLLSLLTSLMSAIGLNIQEAHAFCTADGYSLDVFVVDGWAYEGTEQLKRILVKEISNIETHSGYKQGLGSSAGELGQFGFKLPPNNLNLLSDGSDDWEIDAKLLTFEYKTATGSYGDLYKGTFRSQDVVIKVVKAQSFNADTQREFAQEVYILRKVRHKNVVQFIGACTRSPHLCIVTEFMSGGSVYDFLHKHKGAFKLPAILKVAIDASKGMIYLHENNIIHRDLKAANLLMDENEIVKIADFGVARVQLQSGVMTAETGTYRWMAPEVIGHEPYNHKADVFSFGIVLWELLTGELPYMELTPLQAAVGVFQEGLRPKIPEHTHPILVELLQRCWQQDPSLRPEFSEITQVLQNLANTILEEERASKRRNLGESSCQPMDEWPLKRQGSENAA